MDKRTTVTIINDCRDYNAQGRQTVRAASLFDANICFIGVAGDIEAAGNILDVIDAGRGAKNIILVNVAPRHGKAKKWGNGTPFCYFKYQNSIIASTFDGLTLSLVKKFGLTKDVHLIDTDPAIERMIKAGIISESEKEHLQKTQFRSYDFLPRVAKLVYEEGDVPGKTHTINDIDDAPLCVWWIDNFGNCKTTLTEDDVEVVDGKVDTKFGKINFFNRLKDVPDHEPAVIFGSSGADGKRFLEIVVQGGSAAKHFGISSGDIIL